MATQETIIINEGFEERRRTTASGVKSRFTFTIVSEPIFMNFDDIALGAGPAAAIRDLISAGIKGISQVASAATILRRKYAAAAFARGQPGTVRRYSGGRTGATPPGESDRLYNDSGRLANGVFVRQNPSEGSWTVNVPANRLDPSTFKTQGLFVSMVDRLRDLVPAIRNPMEDPKVIEAISVAVHDVLITKMEKTTKRGEELVFEATMKGIETAIRLIQAIDEALGA